MEPKDDVFNGTRDRYKGVTVSTASESFEITKFPIKLQSDLKRFQGKRIYFLFTISIIYRITRLLATATMSNDLV